MDLYRLMIAAPDGLPETGTKFGMLGVRPRDPARPKRRYDVPATRPTDVVRPGQGGMSVNTDPTRLPSPDDEFVLWVIDDSALGPELVAQPAGPPHYHVEPRRDMTLAELQQELARTRSRWARVEPGENS